jgi:hypothetical protein
VTTRTRRTLVGVGVLVGGLIVLNLLARGLDRAVGGNEPGGVRGSAYATSGDGLAAYASLLRQFGHEVKTQRGELTRTEELTPDATAVVVDPQVMTDDDATVLLQFVTSGGRLVLGGPAPFYVRDFRDHPPKWDASGQSAWVDVAPAVGAVRVIETASQGSWTDPGSGEVVVGTEQRSLLTRDHVGRGEIWFLADPSPLTNDYLGRSDNAAFGLRLAGSSDRPVVFTEGLHGFGETRGLAAIPNRWKVAFVVLALAVLVFMWSRSRRFGPPDRAARDLSPARAEYVRALSVSLERTRDPVHALAPLQQWARERLTASAGLPPDAPDRDVAAAASTRGYTEAEIAALLAPPVDTEAALALGRATAHLGEHDRRDV